MLPHQTIQNPPTIKYRNIADLLISQAKKYPKKDFIICPGNEDETYTYENFLNIVCKTIDFLYSKGLKQGDRINLVIPNSSEFLFFYFAGLFSGITIVTVNEDISPPEISYIVNDSESKAIIYDDTYNHKITDLSPLITPKVQKHPLSEFKNYLKNINHITNYELQITDYDHDAVIIYPSGTTGNPKGVVLTHLNLLADAKAVSSWFQFTPETRTLCILPLFHNNGQIMTLLNPLYSGGSTVIIKGKASLMSFWGLVDKYKINWTSVMPSILSILLSLKKERTDNTMQGIFCGGQILTQNVQEEFEKRFRVPIFEGFGLTETTSFACFNYYPKEKRKIGSIGKPLPVNEMTIVDELDNELPPYEEGEICIRGLNVAKEYLKLPEKNASSFRNGWFHSGDFGYKDDENYFYFKTRKDFLIIKGGENIYPAELENIIFKHPAISEVAVLGIPDKLLGEEICAFVKLHEGAKTTEKELKDFCKGKISAFKQAKKIFIIDELPDLDDIPKGPTKKVLYRKLKEYYLKKIITYDPE